MRKLTLTSLVVGLLLILSVAAATDPFASSSSGLSSPAAHAAAVTPDDATDLTTAPRALFLGAGGDVKVTMVGGETVTFTNAPQGYNPLRVTRVWSTGTTATNITAVW